MSARSCLAAEVVVAIPLLICLAVLVIFPEMGWGWKFLFSVWCGFWAFVFVAATVPAHQAITNLQSWADFFGLSTAAQFVARRGIDLAAQVTSSIAVLLGIVNYALRFYDRRRC